MSKESNGSEGKVLRYGTDRQRREHEHDLESHKQAKAKGDHPWRWKASMARLWAGDHKRTVAAVAAMVAVAIVLAAIYAPLWWPSGGPPQTCYTVGEKESYVQGDRVITGPIITCTPYNTCTQDWRPAYGLGCVQQRSFFRNASGSLPAYPIDLAVMSHLLWSGFTGQGGVTHFDACTPDGRCLNKNYWEQPELYPGWHGNTTVQQMISGGPYWTPRGYGTYPWVRGFNVTGGTGTTIQTLDMLHAAFNVTHWQGFGIYLYFPSAAYYTNGSVWFNQDPAAAAKVLSAVLMNSNDTYYDSLRSDANFTNALPAGGRFLLLPPTKSYFTPGWVIPLRLSITVKNITPGQYVIGIGTVDPNAWVAQEYYLRYGELFVPSGTWYSGTLMQYVVDVSAG